MRIIKTFLLLFTIILNTSQVTFSRSVESPISDYEIVLPINPSKQEVFAGNELSDYLLKITGYKLTVKQGYKGSKKRILVGEKASLKELASGANISFQSKVGVIVQTIQGNLILSGDGPRGPLEAVYCFLNNFAGVRWWTPTSTYIPNNPKFSIKDISFSLNPAFYYRDHFTFNTISDPQFAAHMRENGDDQHLTQEQGGNIKILGFAHTFSMILPPSKYFKIHPEWYTDPGKKGRLCTKDSDMPGDQKTQLCLTNEPLYKEFIKNTLDWIAKNPSYDIISVSQNDNNNYCNCENCKRINTIEGSPSGAIIRFVNRVSNDVAKVYPQKKIETLAYSYSIEAPKVTRPNKNVIVRIAPINANFGYSLTDNANAETKRQILSWAKISNELFYWGYNTNFDNLILPHPSFRNVGNDLKFLSSCNFKGVFLQDNKYTNGVGYFLDLQSWVVAQLLWNPNLNQDDLTNEFMNGYYGAGGAFLKQYMDLIDASFKTTGSKLLTFNTNFSYINSDVLNQGQQLFSKAILAVKGNDVFLSRIMKEKAVFDFSLLYFRSKIKDKPVMQNRAFSIQGNSDASSLNVLNKLDSLGVKKLSMKSTLDDYRRNMGVGNIMTRQDITTKKITIQQGQFTLYKKGDVTDIIADPPASDGQSAYISPTTDAWAIQANLNDYGAVFNGNSWTVSAFLRYNYDNQNQSRTSGSVIIGVYDTQAKKNKVTKSIQIKTVPPGKYIEVKLPAVTLKRTDYIWISVKTLNGLNQRLLVDKLELNKLTIN